jgi:predicted DNA binding CopG/RHH family protein
MSRIKHTNERLGRLRVVPDFLPPPSELASRDDGVKVTISLSRRSVDFFKAEARKHNTQYQRMIRRLLDSYAEKYMESPDKVSERTRDR